MTLALIPDFGSRTGDPLFLFGLAALIVIFTVIAFATHARRKVPRQKNLLVLKKTACPVCRGAKIVNSQKCGRCGGVGTILMI